MTLTAPDRTDALAERLFAATLAALELFSVFLAELGLYDALAQHGPLTAEELGRRAGVAPRYAVEWLEQQAVAGLLDVEHPDAAAGGRRYRLAPDHARVLLGPDDPAHVAPFAHMLAGIGGVLRRVADAFRTGGGVPYEANGRAFRHGQGRAHQPPRVHARARGRLAGRDARRRRSAAGRRRSGGRPGSSLAVARAFRHARIDGIDLDPASIADATRHAVNAGVADRIRFLHADATQLSAHGPYDLVLILEALHDMTDPAATLRAARAALAPDGTVLVVDERVADSFTAPGDEVERMMYGWSVTHCLHRARRSVAAVGGSSRAAGVAEAAPASATTPRLAAPASATTPRLPSRSPRSACGSSSHPQSPQSKGASR